MPASSKNRDAPTSKRQKSITNDLICPITLELPLDPVTAEDGRIYERSAIEEFFKSKSDSQLKSPMTNQKMGRRLLPAFQQKNHIAALIENNLVGGDLAVSWKKKDLEKKELEYQLKKAENGDAEMMYVIGVYLELGQRGFKKNCKLAYSWYKKSHDAGDVKGTAAVGEFHLRGEGGVEKCQSNAVLWLTRAAMQGSNFAAYVLAEALSSGSGGFQKDNNEAIYWFKKIVDGDCAIDHLSSSGKDHSREMLQLLTNESTAKSSAHNLDEVA